MFQNRTKNKGERKGIDEIVSKINVTARRALRKSLGQLHSENFGSAYAAGCLISMSSGRIKFIGSPDPIFQTG